MKDVQAGARPGAGPEPGFAPPREDAFRSRGAGGGSGEDRGSGAPPTSAEHTAAAEQTAAAGQPAAGEQPTSAPVPPPVRPPEALLTQAAQAGFGAPLPPLAPGARGYGGYAPGGAEGGAGSGAGSGAEGGAAGVPGAISPAGPGSWPPYPGAPGPAPQTTNGQAIASFVLAVVAIVPAAVACGIVALVRIHRTRQRGKGLAVAGLALSAVWTIGLVLVLVTGGLYASGHVFGGARGLRTLAVGACYDEPEEQRAVAVTQVSCSRPHDRQLFARVPLSGPYPGSAREADHAALMACIKAEDDYEESYFVDPAALTSVHLYSYYPEEPLWGTKEAVATCAIEGEDGAELTHAYHQSTSAYTDQQIDYLALVSPSHVLRHQILDTSAADWAEGMTLANALASEDMKEAAELRADDTLTTPALRQAVLKLASADETEAVLADDLANTASQAQWAPDTLDSDSDPHASAEQAVRADLGLTYQN